jgi:hypothetical protein
MTDEFEKKTNYDIWWLKEECRILRARISTLERQLISITNELHERLKHLETRTVKKK